jgi:hypothetical protein
MESVTISMIVISVLVLIVPISVVLLLKRQEVLSRDSIDRQYEKLYTDIRVWSIKNKFYFRGRVAPYITWDASHGRPMLYSSLNEYVGLSYWSRILLWFGLTSKDYLNIQYCRKQIS